MVCSSECGAFVGLFVFLAFNNDKVDSLQQALADHSFNYEGKDVFINGITGYVSHASELLRI